MKFCEAGKDMPTGAGSKHSAIGLLLHASWFVSWWATSRAGLQPRSGHNG